MKASRWIKLYLAIPFILITTLVSINFIVDPYSMTSYNLLNIPNKFSRDDRVEKVTHLKTASSYDNIMLGSSRVYSMNPLIVSKFLGGTTYNAAVGTARIEDHLGFLKLLKRLNKMPKNIIIGLDFYTFNKEVESTKYFLKNNDLNFLSGTTFQTSYISNFVSIDAFRASFKTLKNFVKNSNKKPFFDQYGAGGDTSKIFSFTPRINQPTSFPDAEIITEYHYVKTIHYKQLSKKRLNYLKEFIEICQSSNINLYMFITPLYGSLLTKIENDDRLFQNLNKLRKSIQQNTHFYDFTYHNSIIDNAQYFGIPTHTTTEGGNLILKKILSKDLNTFPPNFGVLMPQENL